MQQEDTMTDIDIWHAKALGTAACKALIKNGFDAHYMETGAEAAAWVLSLVRPGMKVGTGGSMTLHQLGLHKDIEEAGATLLYHSKVFLERWISARPACSDLFLSGTNAIPSTASQAMWTKRHRVVRFLWPENGSNRGWNKIVRNSEEARPLSSRPPRRTTGGWEPAICATGYCRLRAENALPHLYPARRGRGQRLLRAHRGSG